MSKWELRLKKMRGEPVSNRKVAEPDSFVREMILKTSRLPEDKILPFIDSSMRKVALGQGTVEGSPKALMDMIGLTGVKEEEDVGEL